MTETEMVLYGRLMTKAKEWAKSKGLSDEYGMGALNAMWYTISAALPDEPERTYPPTPLRVQPGVPFV